MADALEAALRMKDLEPVVRSSDYGKDEDMAEVREYFMDHCFVVSSCNLL